MVWRREVRVAYISASGIVLSADGTLKKEEKRKGGGGEKTVF